MSELGKVAIFPALLYCKQLLHAEVYGPALPVSGYEFQPEPFFYISPFHKHFDIIARSDMLSLPQHLSSDCTVIHCIFLMRLFFSNLPIVTLKISSYRFSCKLKQLFD